MEFIEKNSFKDEKLSIKNISYNSKDEKLLHYIILERKGEIEQSEKKRRNCISKIYKTTFPFLVGLPQFCRTTDWPKNNFIATHSSPH